MDVIKFSIRNPVTVIVGVLLIVLFGIVALQRIPYQLSPNVQQPIITVTTFWPGATPYEVERDIIEEQEKALKGIPNLYQMESIAANNRAQVTLRFTIGTDIESALLRVSNKLDEVPSYPENVDKPVLNASGAESSPVVWTVLKTLEGNDQQIATYRTFFENDVRQFLDRVPGVAELFIGGGVEREMHVLARPDKMAAYNLTVDQVINALRSENANISAGNLYVGRRDYRIRTVAEYRNTEDILNVVIVSDGTREVTVRDIADVQFGYEKLSTPMLSNKVPGIAIGVRPEPNVNVLELTNRLEVVVQELNAGILKDNGVYLDWVNEQRPYILGALNLLRQNIAIGGTLAICVLLVFLRSIAPTIVVGTAIPISIIGTFIIMRAAGTSLNVVSLAGIAFAVGMLVDNAIVVLENIYRHRSMGKTPFAAAYDGTREVWGAVLASSLTTIAVFLPVVFLQDEAGQLFREIAIAVSSAVFLSLTISMTVIPMFSYQLYSRLKIRPPKRVLRRLRSLNIIGRVGSAVGAVYIGLLTLVLRNVVTRLATIITLASGALLVVYLLLPKMEYLPEGNRDLIINILIPPPGLSYDEQLAIGHQVFDYLDPYFEPGYEGKPGIRNSFFVARGTMMILGVVSADQQRARELLPVCQAAINTIPGVFGISNQASIFQQGLGKGRTIDVDLSGNDIDELVDAAGAMFGMLREEIPEAQVRPVPSLELLYPEARFVPSRERLRAVGMSAREFGIALDVLMDGRDIGDFKQEGEKKIDLVLKIVGDNLHTPEDLHNAVVVTPRAGTVPVASLAEMHKTTGLTEIRHLERNRTITLQVTPPYSITLQEAMERINDDIVPRLREQGMLRGITVGMSGAADKLVETRQALQWNFVMAAAIIYLLMSALFGNFLYPFIIMFTVPLASAGGLVGLRLVDRFIAPQQLDILTMLGFIILIGIVVNNAILVVYQSLNNIREDGMEKKTAIIEAVRIRLRPIYMSASTSIFGMMPLVLWPGPGSELYRGLGSVVLGGLAASTIFSVFLIPPMLMFVIGMEKKKEIVPVAAEAPQPQEPTVLPI
jgi:hydrophobic/amphiphilic exporter-1 (mainly G- bacteria), HAE1 family